MTIKKITALLMLSVLPLGVLTAQELNEKDYLPKAGDWAIGIDMQPVYEFFGNLFYTGQGGAATNRNSLGQFGGEETFGIANIPFSIMGKYMLDNTMALRVNLGLGKQVLNNNEFAPDDLARFLDPLSEADVIDNQKINRAAYSIAAGLEFRRGKERIQGYAGADLLFAMNKTKYNYTWGNAITEINQTPSHTNNFGYAAGAGYNPGYAGYLNGERVLENYSNSLFLGVAGRVGVEYFVVPKLSFGGEVSLAIYEQFDRQRYVISEGFNAANGAVEQHTELRFPADRTFNMRTDNLGGKLFMMFYF